jgi:hypothetical protein
MRAQLYRVLNTDAKAWRYHVGNRQAQRDSIKSHIETFRKALACKDAYQMVAHTGENSLTYAYKTTHGSCSTSWSRYSDEIAQALIGLGVPTIDCRSADYSKLISVAISGPMIAVGDQQVEESKHWLSYRPLAEVAIGYQSAGCKLHNF